MKAKAAEQSLADVAFLAAFEAGTLEPFRHRDHIRMAWLYLDRAPLEQATRHVVAGIRAFALANGKPGLYHETLTRFWIHLVARHRVLRVCADSVRFLEAHPRLLDKTLVERHYSPELLASSAAKERWLEPDRQPLA